jgi:Ni,Fe-hydrogenase I cytochrome b subunit
VVVLPIWFYLTGDEENIRRVTDSLGYYFIKKKPHEYIHPNANVSTAVFAAFILGFSSMLTGINFMVLGILDRILPTVFPLQ